jgi:predicted secreted protein
MNPMSAIALYATIFLAVLFMVLPWGVRVAENTEQGHASSAPITPRIGKKMLITALISLVVWAIAFVLIKENVYSFREGIGTRV